MNTKYKTYVITRQDKREQFFFEYPCQTSQDSHVATLRKDKPSLLFETRLYTGNGYMLTE